LETLTSPAGTFSYGYSPQPSTLISQLVLPNLARITNHFDALGRLDATALVNTWGHVLDGYGYGHDPLGLRTNVTRNLGWTSSSATAGYDNTGQLTRWAAKEDGGAPRLQEQLGWDYDPAGNLLHRTNNALLQIFATDERNRLETITRTGTLTVSGNTPAPASSVTVNGQSAERYSDFTFASPGHALSNGTNTFTVVANNAGLMGGVTNTLNSSLPSTLNCHYDANGNLTNDGLRTFAYDAENQLTNVSVAGQWKSQFIHDGLGRKRIERDYTWTGAWQQTNETRFVYDGMLVLQERGSNNAAQVTYTRGLDLSATRQGAGGIGGLLARTDHSAFSLQHSYFHFDGSGNVTAMMDAQQHIVARYLYDPFGRQLGQWGELAGANRYRFSSKEVHPQSDLYYYGFRFYDSNLQRWLTEDPIAEAGGINLYQAFFSAPLNFVDRNGLDNIFNPGAGQNAVPNIVAYLDAESGGMESGYQAGEDPFWLIGDMTVPGGGPSLLLAPPGLLQDIVVLSDDTSFGDEKTLASASIGLTLLGRKCLPSAAKPLPGRRGALRSAKTAADVPKSMQPGRIYYERLYDQPGNVQGRVYEFTKPDGSVVTIREHSLGHVKGELGPHFNVEIRPPGGGPKQPLPGGGDGHFFFEQ
jgi:RHS repeat-associated protein